MTPSETITYARPKGRPREGCTCKDGKAFDGFCPTCRAAGRKKGIVYATPAQYYWYRSKIDEASRKAKDARLAERAIIKERREIEREARLRSREMEQQRREAEREIKKKPLLEQRLSSPLRFIEGPGVPRRGDGFLVVDNRGRALAQEKFEKATDSVITEEDHPPFLDRRENQLRICGGCGRHIIPRGTRSCLRCPECGFRGKSWRFRQSVPDA